MFGGGFVYDSVSAAAVAVCGPSDFLCDPHVVKVPFKCKCVSGLLNSLMVFLTNLLKIYNSRLLLMYGSVAQIVGEFWKPDGGSDEEKRKLQRFNFLQRKCVLPFPVNFFVLQYLYLDLVSYLFSITLY